MVRGKVKKKAPTVAPDVMKFAGLDLAVERVPLKKLKVYARNARMHSEDQVKLIAESIRAFGFLNPVLVDEKGEIIAGHGRVMAAKSLGEKDVPVIKLAHLSDAQKKAYRLADNRIPLDSTWDGELLAMELGELQQLENGGEMFALTGFSHRELRSLTKDKAEKEKNHGEGGGEKVVTYDLVVVLESDSDRQSLADRLQLEGYTCRMVEVD